MKIIRMSKICWKGRAFKALSFGRSGQANAGRNFSGRITIFHRGGGSKKLLRRVDFHRNQSAWGLIERIEYDPNRTARIALVRWSSIKYKKENAVEANAVDQGSVRFPAFSYILAPNELKSGDDVLNIDTLGLKKTYNVTAEHDSLSTSKPAEQLYQKKGLSLPLWLAPLGSIIHNIELNPGEGGKLVRAAGTFAQLVKKPNIEQSSIFPNSPIQKLEYSADFQQSKKKFVAQNKDSEFQSKPFLCSIRLPSGQQQLLDVRSRATIGIVSNVDHSARTLTKAGQNRWRGFRPVVRGVAMNPIDHPHGGGEGRTKGGRPSVSPWGKPTKGQRKKKSAQ